MNNDLVADLDEDDGLGDESDVRTEKYNAFQVEHEIASNITVPNNNIQNNNNELFIASI